MKKIIFYIICIDCLVFVIPFLFTTSFSKVEVLKDINESDTSAFVDKTPYDYSRYGIIKLLNKENNEIKELSLDEYLLRCCICRNAGKL